MGEKIRKRGTEGGMAEGTYQEVLLYHEQTKHHYHRFARSAGYMDWKNQPNPFRFYSGTNQVKLPLLREDPPARYMDLFTRGGSQPKPFTLENVAGFLELALGLSAWKAVSGSQWSLRMNPSSGNLHPTESHLILPPVDTLEGGIYHYNALNHSLEHRAAVPTELWDRVRTHFQTNGFLVALASIFWRESWKYGERAFRYCNHDIGHALACLSFSANLHGWKVKYLNALSHEEMEAVLGFDRVAWEDLDEAEHPELLCFVYGNEVDDVPRSLPPDILSAFSDLSIIGTPNRLSETRTHWDAIRRVALQTRKWRTPERRYRFGDDDLLDRAVSQLAAAAIIRKRRSAVAFGGDGSLSRDQFFVMLDKTIPRNDHPPFDVELTDPSIHLLLFVHNVDAMEQGLYFFLRHEADLEPIRRASRADFSWERIDEGFPLYFLRKGNFRRVAAKVSCEQEIAGYGVFSLGMIARFREIVRKEPFAYRHLFWEAGMIGQILYLEAEAHGVRGTGIGCFFDDPVHEIMGLQDNAYQSLYHFTVGDPIEDPRLTTYPPYAHLKRA